MLETKRKRSRNILYVIVAVLVAGSFVFRLLNEMKIEQTSILFVGIPALISLLVIKYSETPKSATGVVFKTVTLFLLLSAILLGEGIVCIIFMAPIFYLVAGIIAIIIEYLKKKNKSKLNTFIIIPVLLLLSQAYEINSEAEILILETKIELPNNACVSDFNKSPNFIEKLPNFFKIGFPKPIAISGKGISVGDFRKIKFESNTKGIGVLHLRIKEKTNNKIIFEVVEDNTHIHHWLTWKEMEVSIENKNNTSIVNWKTKFTCDLGPSWYFKPIEKYGVETMNRFLIASFFKK